MRITDYEPTVGKARDYMATQAGKQPGDPLKAVQAIVEAISQPHPPRHLVLGQTALKRLRTHLGEWTQELDKWQDVSNGADFGSSASTSPEPANAGSKA